MTPRGLRRVFARFVGSTPNAQFTLASLHRFVQQIGRNYTGAEVEWFVKVLLIEREIEVVATLQEDAQLFGGQMTSPLPFEPVTHDPSTRTIDRDAGRPRASWLEWCRGLDLDVAIFRVLRMPTQKIVPPAEVIAKSHGIDPGKVLAGQVIFRRGADKGVVVARKPTGAFVAIELAGKRMQVFGRVLEILANRRTTISRRDIADAAEIDPDDQVGVRQYKALASSLLRRLYGRGIGRLGPNGIPAQLPLVNASSIVLLKPSLR